ncbi:hypothetical protein H4S06_006464, partial [Coemansia sp. BCRC 34490]
RTARPSCCSSTAATPARCRISAGTSMRTGRCAPRPRTTSCRSGRWLATSTRRPIQSPLLTLPWS